MEDLGVEHLILLCQNTLGLHNWRVDYCICKELKSLMSIKPDRNRGMARIHIRPDVMKMNYEEFSPLLLHEFLHLVLEPIAEEHSFMVAHVVPKDRQNECQARLLRALEKSVEQLSANIGRLLYNSPYQLKQVTDGDPNQTHNAGGI